jgi:hypothetical protein
MGAPAFTGNSVSVVLTPPVSSPLTQALGWTQVVGDTLTLELGYHATGVNSPTVTDTAGNTWVVQAPAGSIDAGNGNGLLVAVALNIKAAASGTNTVSLAWTGGATLGGGDLAIQEYGASPGLDGTPTATIIAGASPVANYTTATANVMAIEAAFNDAGYTAATTPWTDRASTAIQTDGTDVAEQAVATSGSVISTVFNGASGNNCIIVFALKPAGFVSGESDVVFTTSGALGGSGTLTATSAAIFRSSLYVPQFAKLGDFDAQAFALTWFDATEDVGGWWDRVDIPSGPPGAIQGASAVVFAASASPAGAGALAASSAVVFAASATPTITGAASVIFAAAAPGTGSGALVGASAAVFAASATVTGAGALAASSAVVFKASSTPALTGISSAVFAASASLAGAGALAAASSAIFTATATPAASGLAGSASVVFSARATPATPPPPVVVGGQFSFGGSLQPQPLRKRKRRFQTAAERVLLEEQRLRELEEAAAAAAAAAARQVAARVDLIPPTVRTVQAPEPAGPILGAALNVRVVDMVQRARGTSAHWGIASQVLPHGTVQQKRAEAAEAKSKRLRQAVARAHLAQLSAAAVKDRNDTIKQIMAVRLPASK